MKEKLAECLALLEQFEADYYRTYSFSDLPKLMELLKECQRLEQEVLCQD